MGFYLLALFWGFRQRPGPSGQRQASGREFAPGFSLAFNFNLNKMLIAFLEIVLLVSVSYIY